MKRQFQDRKWTKKRKLNDKELLKFDKTKVGDYVFRGSYYKVKYKDEKKIQLENDNVLVEVEKNLAEAELYNANSYDEERMVTQEEILQYMIGSNNIPFTVCFRKKVNIRDALSKIAVLKDDEDEKCLELLKGEKREIVGRFLSLKKTMGYTYIMSLKDEDHLNPVKAVDNRSIEWLIFANKKYIVK